MRYNAVALSFDERTGLPPKIEINSEHLSVDQILAIAHQYGVPVVNRATLASSLSDLPIDTAIPQELYEIVAALIVEIQGYNSKDCEV